MALKIFCPVWGQKHLTLLREALCASLFWSSNERCVKDAEWLITTDSEASANEIRKIIYYYFTGAKCKEFIYPEISRPGVDSGMLLIKSVQEAVDICLRDNSPMLMATPDFIYGNGTIDAFYDVAHEPGTCATIANVRVLPSFLEDMPDPEMSYHGHFTDRIFRHLHPSWKESPKNLFRGGVNVIELTHSKLYAVQHFMPSPFFVNFLPEDKQHFREWHERKPPGFGLWDHVWPSHLLSEGRLRYIGSSDAAVMAEVTDEDKNVPPLNKPGEKGFFRDHFHNNIQSQFVTIFRRGEE